MKVLVTGSHGFIGKNFCLFLKLRDHEILEFNSKDSDETLKKEIAKADFIVHLAGVNKPADTQEFHDVNFGLTKKLVEFVQETKSKAPILLVSSALAAGDSAYGQSKALAESVVNNLGFNGHPVYVYRLAHVFGKWCKPNYNSVVATFCYNVSHSLPVDVNEKAPNLDFVYIDDVCKEFIRVIEDKPLPNNHILYVEPTYYAKPSELIEIIRSFRSSRENLMLPLQDGFEKKLYATYLSYLPEGGMSYPLVSHSDNRGSFIEFFKTKDYGQLSVNVIKPGAVKGNHYHLSKNEKYLVVSGSCDIQERSLLDTKIATYHCGEKNLVVVDIAPGFVHSIKNVGSQDAVVLMWASDVYDKNNEDTYPEMVEPEKV
jgi:UDP-2-acetamido-2,6-beta-L-arabino-hexul-4-ose reductase